MPDVWYLFLCFCPYCELLTVRAGFLVMCRMICPFFGSRGLGLALGPAQGLCACSGAVAPPRDRRRFVTVILITVTNCVLYTVHICHAEVSRAEGWVNPNHRCACGGCPELLQFLPLEIFCSRLLHCHTSYRCSPPLLYYCGTKEGGFATVVVEAVGTASRFAKGQCRQRGGQPT